MKTIYADFFYGATPEIFARADKQRKNPTEAERKLWFKLRKKQIDGLTFRRQHPIGKYIVDFYCHKAKLIIEIDGGIHLQEDILQNDKERESELIEQGLKVLRFTNEQVLYHSEKVISEIKLKCDK